MEVFKKIEMIKVEMQENMKRFGKGKFGDIANEWLEMKNKEVKESTYYNYAYKIDKYLMQYFQGYKMKSLEKYDYNSFLDELVENYSLKTVRDILNVLKSILKYANDEYCYSINYEKIKAPKLEIKKLRVLNKREKNKLERYCYKENSLKSLGIIICLNTGLRIGEICALKWKDIDFEEKNIYVRKTLQRVYNRAENNSKVIIDVPKTASSIRSIPISNKVYDILKTLKKGNTGENFLLTGLEDKYIEPRNYENAYKKILKKSKVKPHKFHILRHTFATDCVEVGMDIKSLSEILGHSDVDITLNRYVHSSYKMKKKYLEKL